MKRKNGKRAIALFLALALSTSAFSTTAVFAAEPQEDEAAQAEAKSSTTYEPWAHGFRFVDILNYDPATDDYSDELKAYVPLQERNEQFAATQANPNLDEGVSLYAISSGNYRSTDVTNAPWNGNHSYDDFSFNAYKFWQYTDLIGAGGRPTAGIIRGSDNKEYGTVALPTVSTINAAHKNGVKALGEYFVPRTPQYTEEWLYKDEEGNFPYAQKLIDIMNDYGFDGYFINQEEGIDASYVPLFKEMLKWMRDQGCYIQWYDSITDQGYISYQNHFNSTNSNWVWNAENGRVSDSIFLNYWNLPSYGDPNTDMQADVDYLESINEAHPEANLDAHEVIYYGVEGGQWRWSQDLDRLLDSTGNSRLSFAIWGSDFYREQYGQNDNLRYQADYQWANEERERMYFTAPSENVGDYESVDRPDVEVTGTAFKGFSKYVAERSVIDGSVFTTDFNNGHGMQYFEDGEVSRNVEWTNVNLQDILPTWQWWVESTDDNQLELDWDYGPEQGKVLADGTESSFDYEQIGAYNGGSSLAIYGSVAGSQYISLYKTALDVTADTTVSLTYNKPSADDSSTMQIGLIFESNPEQIVYLPIADSGKQTSGWQTATFELDDTFAGDTIAAIGVEISAEEQVDGYQMNLGGLKVSDGQSYAPAAPTGFAVEKQFDTTGEYQFSWNINENYDEVQLYRLYAEYADGSERFIGGAYTDNYYVQTLENPDEITAFNLYAVGIDGSMSEAASVAANTGKQVSNVLAASGNNAVTVTWDDSADDYQSVKAELSYWYSDKENPEAVTVEKGVGEAAFDVPLEDGSKYLITLTTINSDGSENAPVSYFGELADNYCAPFEGEFRHEGSSSTYILTTPIPEDWDSMTMEINGSVREYTRFNGSSAIGINIPQDGMQTAVITLTDRNGNVSAPTTFIFINGEPVGDDSEYTEEFVPDDALRAALQEKIGPTYSDLTSYLGELDLSGLDISDLTGLNLVSGLTGLNLSGTSITSIERAEIPSGITYLNLSGCESLTTIAEGAISALTALDDLNLSGCTGLTTLYLDNTPADLAVDLTGCTALETLALTGTEKTTFDISALTSLVNFYANDSALETLTTADAADYANAADFNLSGSRFDMTAGTPEGDFARALAEAASVDYSGQRPVIYFAELPEVVDVTKKAGATLRTMDYFEAYYNDAETVRGTVIADMTDLDWVAEDYDIQGDASVPTKVYAEIFDSEGNMVNEPDMSDVPEVDTETNVALNARILGGSGITGEAETYAMMFDGSVQTKWCVGAWSGWAAFALDQPEEIGRWVSMHAQANGEPAAYNTEDFELQVLNTEAVGMTEEEFLASDSATNSAILSNDANWITVDHVTDNTAGTVDRNIEETTEAQVYRLKINRSINGDQYQAVRLQELELYRADPTPRDYEGILELDNPGLYTVNFIKNGTQLNTMQVAVSAQKVLLQAAIDYAAAQDTTDVIDSVKAMYDAAMANAQAVLANNTASEEEVWDAIDQLMEACWSLGFIKGDKSELEDLITVAEGMDADKYVADNWQLLVDALADAQAVYEDGDAMQGDVDAAQEALLQAILAQRYKADKSILEELLNKANAIDTTKYTAESVQAFTAALKAANLVMEDESLSEDEQATVDEAEATLRSAMDNLVETSAEDPKPSDDNKDDNTSTQDPNKGPMDDNKNPATGDNTNLMVWFLLAAASLSALAVVVLRKSRKHA